MLIQKVILQHKSTEKTHLWNEPQRWPQPGLKATKENQDLEDDKIWWFKFSYKHYSTLLQDYRGRSILGLGITILGTALSSINIILW
jgi:hypothetical protein